MWSTPERFRGDAIHLRRYTNVLTFTFYRYRNVDPPATRGWGDETIPRRPHDAVGTQIPPDPPSASGPMMEFWRHARQHDKQIMRSTLLGRRVVHWGNGIYKPVMRTPWIGLQLGEGSASISWYMYICRILVHKQLKCHSNALVRVIVKLCQYKIMPVAADYNFYSIKSPEVAASAMKIQSKRCKIKSNQIKYIGQHK